MSLAESDCFSARQRRLVRDFVGPCQGLSVGQSNQVNTDRSGCPGVLTLAENPDCPIEWALVMDVAYSSHIMLIVRGSVALLLHIAICYVQC